MERMDHLRKQCRPVIKDPPADPVHEKSRESMQKSLEHLNPEE